MRIRGLAVVMAIAFTAGGAAAPASAQTPEKDPAGPQTGETGAAKQTETGEAKPDFEAAKQHYIVASKALGDGDYLFAAKEFGAAYAITKDPILFFKIALSHDKAGDCGSALIFYRRYLAEANPTGQDKIDAEERREACDKQLAPVAPITSRPPGPSPEDTPSPNDAKQPNDGEASASERPATGESEQPEEDSDLYHPNVGAATPMQTAAWLSIGASVAAAVTAAVFAISAATREDDLSKLVALPPDGVRLPFEGSVREQYEDLLDEGKQQELLSYIAWGISGAAAITAVVLFIIDDGANEDDRAATGAKTTVAPMAGPEGTIGVTATWGF